MSKPMPDMTMKEAFADMMQQSFPTLPTNSNGYDAMRCSFFGGAWIVLLRMMMASNMNLEDGFAQVDKLKDELEEFRKHTGQSVAIFADILKAGERPSERRHNEPDAV